MMRSRVHLSKIRGPWRTSRLSKVKYLRLKKNVSNLMVGVGALRLKIYARVVLIKTALLVQFGHRIFIKIPHTHDTISP